MFERKDGALTLWSLVGIMYFASSGGPEGTEGVVRSLLYPHDTPLAHLHTNAAWLWLTCVPRQVAAMGPGGALLGICGAALLWSAPIALMSAELGTAVPENGGAMVSTWKQIWPWGEEGAGARLLLCLRGI